MNFDVIIGHGHHADVEGGLYHALRHVGVTDHAVRHGVQQTNEAVARLRRQRGFIRRNGIQQQDQILLFGRQLVFKDLLVGIDQGRQGVRLVSGYRNGGEGFTRNGVTQGAAVEINQAQVQLGGVTGEEAGQQLVGIPQADVDFTAGVAAFQPF